MQPETIFMLAVAVAVVAVVLAIRKSRKQTESPKDHADRIKGEGE